MLDPIPLSRSFILEKFTGLPPAVSTPRITPVLSYLQAPPTSAAMRSPYLLLVATTRDFSGDTYYPTFSTRRVLNLLVCVAAEAAVSFSVRKVCMWLLPMAWSST